MEDSIRMDIKKISIKILASLINIGLQNDGSLNKDAKGQSKDTGKQKSKKTAQKQGVDESDIKDKIRDAGTYLLSLQQKRREK